jgi:mannose-6-phosphate isomerase-like protein (cupin superfamily)
VAEKREFMSTSDAPQAHVPADEGERLSFMGMDLIWKITSKMSGGSLCSFIQVAPPGTGVPLHIHHHDDEFFYLLEGSLRMLVNDEAITMEVGDTVLLPKGKPHGFLVTGEQPARVLMTLSLSAGSDYEAMFAGLVGLAPTDFERILDVCGANNVEFITPPVMP